MGGVTIDTSGLRVTAICRILPGAAMAVGRRLVQTGSGVADAVRP